MATTMGNLQTVLEETANDVFKQHRVNFKKIVIAKKSNDFKNGDFVIPKGSHDTIALEELCSIRQDLMEQIKSEKAPVSTIDGDTYNSIVIHLDRTQCFKQVVTSVLQAKENYGLCQSALSGHILLHNANLVCPRHHDSGDQSSGMQSMEGKCDVTLDCVRSVVLQEHIAHLLQAHGLTVSSVATDGNIDLCKNLFVNIGSDPDKFTRIQMNDDDNGCMTDKLLTHSCVKKVEEPHIEGHDKINRLSCSPDKEGHDKSVNQNVEKKITCKKIEEKDTFTSSYEFNLRKYIQDTNLPVGRTQFDTNLNICNVMKNGHASDVLKQACLIQKGIQNCKATGCIHITDQTGAFSLQKVHLIVQAMIENGSGNGIPQMHFVYGSVTPRKDCVDSEKMTAEDYFRLRYSQMRQAAVMKYGDTVHGEGWTSTLQVLTAACIKFEMLSSVPRNTVKLNLSDVDMDNSGEATLSGSFVMYNCARLATLFSHFEQSVETGMYPPLPQLEEIDFTTLREEQEWSLLFNYVYMFPDVVTHTLETFPSTDTIYAKIHTHKICQMLCSLSRSISSYYSRFHVLGEPRAHLLPTMYARLYLLKVVYQVLVNGLTLLGIQPLSQL